MQGSAALSGCFSAILSSHACNFSTFASANAAIASRTAVVALFGTPLGLPGPGLPSPILRSHAAEHLA
jgi:hypothetical protein